MGTSESFELLTSLLFIMGYLTLGMVSLGLIGLLSWYLKRAWDV